ncbi:MAG: hypothetical protein VE98_C0001G0425 [candidate division Kazan bacterium GW2011_GWA1_50_15]|uniref:Uncharacterized protein n=1 Tax=candidate division Kazan bacterium GW2011_GWA1_50_15 TaxID=1620412 RepID=A0A0G4BAH3_UNCK3|nr:MAG: hypothetical protein VE98_C0001G0425 [candidate division Kazan bacterium GW2011_GWA1_50_15]KKW25885.1 MAG: hypothetical protein VE99_C0001G0524 [candidate division Kazan bacterium GW2011_GWC1_52_13]
MQHLFHHLRRDRSYSSHERWGVVVALGILTILISAGGFILFGNPAASASSLAVTDIRLTSQTLPADGANHGQATITISDKKTDQAVVGVWVGLQIVNPVLRGVANSYLGWYSPEPQRAFYQTDVNGQVQFPLISEIAADIEYAIYAANPELKNDNKYQELDRRFTVTFK